MDSLLSSYPIQVSCPQERSGQSKWAGELPVRKMALEMGHRRQDDQGDGHSVVAPETGCSCDGALCGATRPEVTFGNAYSKIQAGLIGSLVVRLHPAPQIPPSVDHELVHSSPQPPGTNRRQGSLGMEPLPSFPPLATNPRLQSLRYSGARPGAAPPTRKAAGEHGCCSADEHTGATRCDRSLGFHPAMPPLLPAANG